MMRIATQQVMLRQWRMETTDIIAVLVQITPIPLNTIHHMMIIVNQLDTPMPVMILTFCHIINILLTMWVARTITYTTID